MVKAEIKKKINFKNLPRLKNSNKKNEDIIWYVNIIKKDDIIKKNQF